MIFKYRSKGTVDNWTTETIEAKDEKDAIAQLDSLYGVIRDKNGKQTNSHLVKVELIKESRPRKAAL